MQVSVFAAIDSAHGIVWEQLPDQDSMRQMFMLQVFVMSDIGENVSAPACGRVDHTLHSGEKQAFIFFERCSRVHPITCQKKINRYNKDIIANAGGSRKKDRSES